MPFVKGQSGNPGGRSKEKPFRDALRMELAAAGEDGLKLREIAAALIDKAAGGDVQAAVQIRDTLDGKPAQAIIGGDGDDPPVTTVTRIELVPLDGNPTDQASS
jgi:hypothetical protein